MCRGGDGVDYCVYVHTFPNGKRYVGITSRKPKERWDNGNGYLRRNRNGEYTQPLMANAIVKYGWQNIHHDIICEGLSKEDAEQMEKDLIALYKANWKGFGYNLRSGGGLNSVFTEESRKKMSASRTGEKNHMFGKHLSAETIERIRQANRRPKSEEARKHMSENHADFRGAKNGRARKVAQYTQSGELVAVWEYIKQAGGALGIGASDISACCRGVQQTAGGYHWQYAN